VVVREPCSEVVARMFRLRVRLLAELVRFMPDPEALMRGAAASSVPGRWSRGEAHAQGTDIEEAEQGNETG